MGEKKKKRKRKRREKHTKVEKPELAGGEEMEDGSSEW